MFAAITVMMSNGASRRITSDGADTVIETHVNRQLCKTWP